MTARDKQSGVTFVGKTRVSTRVRGRGSLRERQTRLDLFQGPGHGRQRLLEQQPSGRACSPLVLVPDSTRAARGRQAVLAASVCWVGGRSARATSDLSVVADSQGMRSAAG